MAPRFVLRRTYPLFLVFFPGASAGCTGLSEVALNELDVKPGACTACSARTCFLGVASFVAVAVVGGRDFSNAFSLRLSSSVFTPFSYY